MIQTLLGYKGEQSQKFLENGRRIPVTKIRIDDNIVVQVKSIDKDAYSSVQLGIDRSKHPTKQALGHSKKAGIDHAPRFIRETRIADTQDMPQPGDHISAASIFTPGSIIHVTGTSKGKGFAGVVKRHNFRGGPKTHGQSDRHRAPGSIGQTTTPGRVYKGKRMAGHMGTDTVTIQNLQVVDIDIVNKILFVKGLVPGHINCLLQITKSGEVKKFIPLVNPTQNPVEEPPAETAKEDGQVPTESATDEVPTDAASQKTDASVESAAAEKSTGEDKKGGENAK